MQKRQYILLMTLLTLILVGAFVGTPVAQAIGKITPTPDGDNQGATKTDPESLLQSGISKIQEKDYEGAIADLTIAIGLDDSLWDAYFFRAFAYASSGQYALAIDDYTRALEIRPGDYTTYTLRGDVNFLIGETGEAGLDYEQAIFLSPRYAQAYRGRSKLNLQKGNRELSALDDYIARGLDEAAQGNTQAALDFYGDAIKSIDRTPPPEMGAVYYNRASLYIGQNKWQQALDDLDQAIELQPQMQDYYMVRGYIYSTQDDPVSAAPDFYQRMRLIESTSLEQTIELGSSQTVVMNFGTVARLTFTGQANQQVTITARDSDGIGVDPLLVLLDPSANPLAGNDDGGGNMDAQIKDFTLPEDGTYTIALSHANGGSEGAITVSLK